MKTSRTTVLILIAAALALNAVTISASDLVGVCAIVEKVTFEPNEATPERVQIQGVFALGIYRADGYTAPVRGYMYFKIPQGREAAVALKEWTDLKAVAGTGQGVAFGTRYAPVGTVRDLHLKPANPDVYEISDYGVIKVSADSRNPNSRENVVSQLQAALKAALSSTVPK